MKTLEEQEEEANPSSTMTTLDRSSENTKLFPTEIIEDILSRLPVKYILRSKSVSKPWHSLIANPSLTKLQFSRATAALSISAYDKVTRKHHLLSAACDGGSVTHLMTVDEASGAFITGFSHVKGLVCFTSQKFIFTPTRSSAFMEFQAFVVNPSTRNIFKLPAPPDSNNNKYAHKGYLFGFDESTKEHKVLHIRSKGGFNSDSTFEFMILSVSNHSWRKIDVEPPLGFSWRRLTNDLNGGVYVNSCVHILLMDNSFDILVFDFVTEKFSFFSIPQGVVPRPDEVTLNEFGFMKVNVPVITKIGGSLGLVLHDQERSEIRIWLLRDYDQREWVKETVKFPKSWNKLVGNAPLSIDVNMDEEIVFSVSKVSQNVMTIPVYNIKSKSFKSLRFTLEDQFLCSKTVCFGCIKCYVESMMALNKN